MDQSKVLEIVDFLEKRYGEEIKHHPTRNTTPFEVLCWAFLSHRTRDENTAAAFNRLFSKAKTPKEILKLTQKEVEKLIYSVGFYRQKAKRLRGICKVLVEQYNSKVPKTREELMEIPGVGFKTSAIVLSESHKVPIIPVDTHVFRCSKRLGLAREDADAEEVREALEKTIPRKRWGIINLGFIKFSRGICKPINPVCVKDRNFCPFTKFCYSFKTKKFYIKPFGKKLKKSRD